MSHELEKLICKTLEENPGAEVRFMRMLEAQPAVLEGLLPVPDRMVISVILRGSDWGRECRMYEELAPAELVKSLELLRRVCARERLSPEAPKDDYVPTAAEQAELSSRTGLDCRLCANTGSDGRGQCVCLDPG